MNSTTTKCGYNDCTLTEAEREDPYMADGEPMCESCYDTWRCENESKCPFCCDYWEDDDLSECFIVMDDELGEPGLYRPLNYPFYAQPLIGRPALYHHAIERIGSIVSSARIDAAGFPAAYVCKSCMGEGS